MNAFAGEENMVKSVVAIKARSLVTCALPGSDISRSEEVYVDSFEQEVNLSIQYCSRG